MIINEEHNFAFIHIPKCAGMYVQKFLGQFDDFQLSHYSTNGTKRVPSSKVSHYSLARLSIFFPEEFEKICRLESYALIRDPRSRFVSSTFQHFRETSKATFFLRFLVRRKIGTLVSKLSSQNPNFLPVALIHFTPQSNYVNFDELRVIKKLYLVNQAKDLVGHILQEKLGLQKLPENLENIHHESRGSKLSLDTLIKNGTSSIIIAKIINNFLRLLSSYAAWLSTKLYDEIEKVVSSEPAVQEFLHTFYAEDFEIHKELISRL